MFTVFWWTRQDPNLPCSTELPRRPFLGTSVDDNTATEGGGIYNDPGNGIATLTLDNSSSVSHNTATATDGGGGIFNNGGTLIGAVAPPTPGANVKNNTPDNIVG